MRRICVFVAFLVAVAVLFVVRPSLANGRFPAANAVIFDPHDAKTVYVRATFGLLVSRDGGDSWRWICERAIGFSGTEDRDPTYVVTPKGTLVGATSSGLAVSRDGGCTFSFAGGPGTHVATDLTMRPDGAIVGISSVHAKAPAPTGAALYDNHLVISNDDVQTVAVAGGPIDEALRIESVKIAESNPARLYMSAVRGEGDTRTAMFLVSYDVGMSWAERKLDLLPGETTAVIAIVDPKNAERVYVRTAGAVDARTRLLVTDDAGKTWKKIFDSATPLLGFALAADGARVFVAGREGLSSSPTDTFAFTKGSSADIQCLGRPSDGTALWACSTERSGFFVGISKNSGGRNFDAKLHLEEIRGPLECPAESGVAKQCTAEWEKLRGELGVPDPGAKPRNVDPGAPGLRGRASRPARSRGGLGAIFGIALFAIAGYYLMKWVRRR